MQAIAIVTKKPFSKIKVYFDSAMVIVSLITCIIMTYTLGSVGLGTIISAILVGTTLKYIVNTLFNVDNS